MWSGPVAAIRRTFVLGAHPRFCLPASGPLSTGMNDQDLFPISADIPDGDAVAGDATIDILCLSHLRWDFVYQRPQHLMTRLAAHHRVFFIEEPRFESGPDRLQVTEVDAGVRVAVPLLAEWRRGTDEVMPVQRALLRRLMRGEGITDYVLWFLTPMALPLARDLSPVAVVYDCMDELSAFAGAPAMMKTLESELLGRADLVTTGGRSLYEAKRDRHPNVHAFPSSIDLAHFARARAGGPEPDDQRGVARPRLGFAGVIDERMDLGLVGELAARRPDWQLVFLGPFAKIDPAAFPRLPNVHLLGLKDYTRLPDYLAGWDVGLLPFAHNDATRFISPTKTPEYLAAGLPVVATSIRDVVTPYGEAGLVRIADGVDAFEMAVAAALGEGRCARVAEVDALLAGGSWDQTASQMRALLLSSIAARRDCAGGGAAAAAGESP
jgi:glycosyltransferase involved in cell wall biosynthesis